MTRPVVIGALAERDIREARAWFDQQEAGLGDRFFEDVKETVSRIASNPEQYRIVFGDARRAPIKTFRYSVWFASTRCSELKSEAATRFRGGSLLDAWARSLVTSPRGSGSRTRDCDRP